MNIQTSPNSVRVSAGEDPEFRGQELDYEMVASRLSSVVSVPKSCVLEATYTRIWPGTFFSVVCMPDARYGSRSVGG